jgi:hypothetical protein
LENVDDRGHIGGRNNASGPPRRSGFKMMKCCGGVAGRGHSNMSQLSSKLGDIVDHSKKPDARRNKNRTVSRDGPVLWRKIHLAQRTVPHRRPDVN